MKFAFIDRTSVQSPVLWFLIVLETFAASFVFFGISETIQFYELRELQKPIESSCQFKDFNVLKQRYAFLLGIVNIKENSE